MSYQHQHVWNCDNIRLVPSRHGGLEVVLSVFPVGHCTVGMECNVFLLTLLSGRKVICPLKTCASSPPLYTHLKGLMDSVILTRKSKIDRA